MCPESFVPSSIAKFPPGEINLEVRIRKGDPRQVENDPLHRFRIEGPFSFPDLPQVTNRHTPILDIPYLVPPDVPADFNVAVPSDDRGQVSSSFRLTEADFEKALLGERCERNPQSMEISEARDNLRDLQIQDGLHRVGRKRGEADGSQACKK